MKGVGREDESSNVHPSTIGGDFSDEQCFPARSTSCAYQSQAPSAMIMRSGLWQWWLYSVYFMDERARTLKVTTPSTKWLTSVVDGVSRAGVDVDVKEWEEQWPSVLSVATVTVGYSGVSSLKMDVLKRLWRHQSRIS